MGGVSTLVVRTKREDGEKQNTHTRTHKSKKTQTFQEFLIESRDLILILLSFLLQLQHSLVVHLLQAGVRVRFLFQHQL